jgi:hypothetical protein
MQTYGHAKRMPFERLVFTFNYYLTVNKSKKPIFLLFNVLSINAGCKALPALANILQVMQQTQVGHILSKDELPVILFKKKSFYIYNN